MNKQLVIKNLLLSFAETESGQQGQSLVFLHGWRSSKEAWSGIIKQMSELGDKQISIYALDLPGFGASQVPEEAMTVGNYAEVVAGFIKKLELKDVILVGHSFGGRVGIKLSAAHPELISKLVLVDSAGFTVGSTKKSALGFIAKLAKPFFRPKFMQGIRKGIYGVLGAEDYLATPQLQKTFVNVVNEDLTEDLKKVSCPTLIINGESDSDTPVEFGRKMSSLIPGSKFVVLTGAGHFSFVDKPEEFAKHLEEFTVL